MSKQDERARALMWWKTLSQEDKVELCHRYKPAWTFEMVNASSAMIHQIWVAVGKAQREYP